MADRLTDTLAQMRDLALTHETVAVGFSGGKDSLAALELAVQHFKYVVPYYYYVVPGLQHEEGKLAVAKSRYGLDVLKYPACEGLEALRIGLYCDERIELAELPVMTRRTLYNWIKADTGATIIFDGEKRADGPFRRQRMIVQQKTMADVIHPLAYWRKWDVLSFLHSRNIPIPDAGRGDNGGFSLMDTEILFAYHHHREDYEVMREYFPYIEAVVLHERWHGNSP